MNQRWLLGRDSYRPAGETIRPAEYEVTPLPETQAKGFVLAHHYSASYPAARFRYGLHRRGQLVGVAVFSVPSNDLALRPLPGSPRDSVELGRFVLLDEVPGNGETWFLGRCFEQLRAAGQRGVVSFSDPVPRLTRDGRQVFAGHLGTIYQAHNGVFLGRATPRTLHLLPDGRVFSDRTAQKIRSRSRGCAYSAAILESAGAAKLDPQEDPRAWLKLWLPQVTHRLRHPGNLKYCWVLNRRDRRALPASLPYPKGCRPVGGLVDGGAPSVKGEP